MAPDGPEIQLAYTPPGDPNAPIGGITGPEIGVVNAAPRFIAPPPSKPAPPRETQEAKPVVRIGGDVLEAKLIKRVIPVYPPLARQMRISGTVRLEGVIARDGRVVNLQIVSGHPLLAGAAVEAVRQWVYRPTLLNGQVVEVIAPIDVRFILSQ
jgi:protein TonB